MVNQKYMKYSEWATDFRTRSQFMSDIIKSANSLTDAMQNLQDDSLTGGVRDALKEMQVKCKYLLDVIPDSSKSQTSERVPLNSEE